MFRRLTLCILVAAAAHAEILDRIAVSVGKQVITEAEVLTDVRVSAFLDQKPLVVNGAEKRKSADRLVDQLLILEEAVFSRATMAAPEEGARMLEQIKTQYPDEAAFRAALERYQITEQDVTNHLLAGLRALRFTDLRFRPEVQFTDEDLHEFYNTLVEEWKSKHHPEIPSFEASRDQVEKLLTDQRTAQALDRWLGSRRTETQIRYREQVFQ